MSGFAVDHHLAVAVGDVVGNAFLRIELLVVLIKILVCNPGADTYIAVRRLKITHDRANERGLARAVGAYHTNAITAHDRSVEGLYERPPCKIHLNIAQFKNYIARAIGLIYLHYGPSLTITS